jgi:hypothetical protein
MSTPNPDRDLPLTDTLLSRKLVVSEFMNNAYTTSSYIFRLFSLSDFIFDLFLIFFPNQICYVLGSSQILPASLLGSTYVEVVCAP